MKNTLRSARLLNKEKVGVNMHFTPHAERNHFIIDSSNIVKDGMSTIFPYDYIGIYNRKKFIQLGGFDYTIKSSYWQNLDLAVRSWLWGEETRLTTMIQFSYIDELPCIDTTVNKDYLTYHLKNELPKFPVMYAVSKCVPICRSSSSATDFSAKTVSKSSTA